MADDVFENKATPNADLNEWVGEGKKYATMEEAAKANIFAQAHITDLERQTGEMRDDIIKHEARGDMLERLQAATQQATQTPSEESRETTAASTEDVLAQVREIVDTQIPEQVQRINAEQRAEANERKVQDAMQAQFGDRGSDAMARKAVELGMTLETMKDLARRSPDAVLKFFPTGTQQGQQITGDVNTTGMVTETGGDLLPYSYFEEIRKTKPSEYFSHAVQKQLLDQAVRHSEQGKEFIRK